MKELTPIEVCNVSGGLSLIVWTLERLGGGWFKSYPLPRPQLKDFL